MKLTIISSQMTGLYKVLDRLGFIHMEGVLFSRSPFKRNGMWVAEVLV